MGKYVLKRLGLAFITGFIILTLVFILNKTLPVDTPVGNDTARNSYWLTEVARGYMEKFPKAQKGRELVDQVTINGRVTYFYTAPIMKQYFRWIGNIITKWDWGTSQQIELGVKATTIIKQRLPYSIRINIISTVIAVPLGIALGIWAALKKNKATDSIISTAVMIFISVPSFIMVTLLMSLLCYNNRILPSQWDEGTVAKSIQSMIIPTLALSFGSIAGYARSTRAELCEVMSSEYLLLARTKGLTRGQAIRRHALRNAMVPIIPGIIAQFIADLTGGSLIVERLYGIPGIGTLYVNALNRKDWNILFVVMAFDVVIGLLSGILLDVSYGFIDPRIRMGAKK
ncbi:MAG: ABC transporter permease [Acholeplasmatales bacterium]|nr:ABC transporter permease [Acholeplasmatales bacterium]